MLRGERTCFKAGSRTLSPPPLTPQIKEGEKGHALGLYHDFFAEDVAGGGETEE